MFDEKLIGTALVAAERLHAGAPEIATLGSVVAQLRYLPALTEGREDDRSRLGQIVLGVQAAREVGPPDEAPADKLCAIDAQVRAMDGGRPHVFGDAEPAGHRGVSA